MPVSELRLIKRCAEFCEKKDIKNIPPWTRGIYVLFKYRPRLEKYDVVYIALAAIHSALMEAVYIVEMKLFGIIPPFWERNITNVKTAEESTTNFQNRGRNGKRA